MTLEKVEMINNKNIGYFPQLQKNGLVNGFAWGNPENFAYTREPGFPESQAVLNVRSRVDKFMDSLGIPKPPNIIIFTPLPGMTDIYDLSKAKIDHLTYLPERGYYLEAGCLFWSQKQLPVTIILGDCSYTYVYAIGNKGSPIAGLIHCGRVEASALLPYNSIDYLIKKYDVSPKDIYLGITPGLGPQHHTIKEEEYLALNNHEKWDTFSTRDASGLVHLDTLSFISSQYKQLGIPETNIESYCIDTYESAAQGLCFSHRYDNEKRNTIRRFGGAVMIKSDN